MNSVRHKLNVEYVFANRQKLTHPRAVQRIFGPGGNFKFRFHIFTHLYGAHWASGQAWVAKIHFWKNVWSDLPETFTTYFLYQHPSLGKKRAKLVNAFGYLSNTTSGFFGILYGSYAKFYPTIYPTIQPILMKRGSFER